MNIWVLCLIGGLWGIMEKKMETTIVRFRVSGLVVRVEGFWV